MIELGRNVSQRISRLFENPSLLSAMCKACVREQTTKKQQKRKIRQNTPLFFFFWLGYQRTLQLR